MGSFSNVVEKLQSESGYPQLLSCHLHLVKTLSISWREVVFLTSAHRKVPVIFWKGVRTFREKPSAKDPTVQPYRSDAARFRFPRRLLLGLPIMNDMFGEILKLTAFSFSLFRNFLVPNNVFPTRRLGIVVVTFSVFVVILYLQSHSSESEARFLPSGDLKYLSSAFFSPIQLTRL